MAALHERRERLAQRGAGDAQLVGEVALGRQPAGRRQQAEPDRGAEPLHRLLEGGGRLHRLENRIHRGGVLHGRAGSTWQRYTRQLFAGKLALHCDAVEVRQESVVVETDRYRVEGMMTLPREGYR